MSKKQAKREIKKLLLAFTPISTQTRAGINEYRRLERHIDEVISNGGSLSKWQRIRRNIIINLQEFDAELNRDLSSFFGFEKQKKKRDG